MTAKTSPSSSSTTTFVILPLFLAAFLTGSTINAFSSPTSRVGQRQTAIAASSIAIDDAGAFTPTVKSFDLGQGKEVEILVPTNEKKNKAGGKGSDGVVIGPSSFAMARILAHCPSLVDDRNVLELGAGLGLLSAAICRHTAPKHLAVTDADRTVLRRAYESCTQLHRPKTSVSRCIMDWHDETTWPNQKYDIVIGSDILYDQSSARSIVKVLVHYLIGSDDDDDDDDDDYEEEDDYLYDDNFVLKRALIVDPIDGRNRNEFARMAETVGLQVEETPFPGMTDEFVLLSITEQV